MQQILGTTPAVFVGLTLVILGGAAWMTGHAVASSWQSPRQVVIYSVLLGLANRFLTWSLFEGDGLSIPGFLVGTGALMIIGLISFRLTHVARMVSQYPWLYERQGLWGYRRRPGSEAGA